ncbi:E3 ubiquitin-protein ligase listerin [Nilaparvata lugens]|uniref:E3 ubiquitin-protein ligase listerin n=1 Tax=Nilaparvata lugens TaxID=108931 RepID=UPI00193D52C2|nr:E3 ubiquitin-protein ligase listerin [Nilaparvata lugens]
MGGKKNQAQRTKNNVRPSSSGRSAELLGSGVTSFVGFSTVKEAGYVPVLSGFAEEVYQNINTNFQLVLKKMNKKDSVTKLKALNEFGALCRESDAATVKAILSYWPRLYCILATDVEHRVREAVHNAHRAVVSAVGRSIAPHLKQLAGAWFCSQFDTYPPAASAASLSFKEAFPPNKLSEAIIFCKEEIMNYIHDNLMNQTPQTLSNPKTTTQDEMEAKYQRVMASCLTGYALFLKELPKEQILQIEEQNKKLVGAAKFWKFSKNPVPSIRAAWFSALVSLCQHAPFLLKDEKKHVTMAVFSNLDEADPTVLPVVWEASLHTIVMIEDWPQYVSAEKLVFPKLWRILKEGGLGSANTIYPNILPLLSNIPASLVPDKQIFYSKLFSNMIEGTKLKSVYQSQMESDTVAQCFMECLSYIVMKNVEEPDLCSQLISTQLMAFIELTIRDSKLRLVRKSLAQEVAKSINQWTGQQHQTYKTLTQCFWTDLYSSCQKLIDSSLFDRTMLNEILNAQAELFNSLFNLKTKQKKSARVTFCEDTSNPVKVIETPLEKSTLNADYRNYLFNFICKMMSSYFKYVLENEANRSSFFKHLSRTVSLHESNELFAFMTLLSVDNTTWDQFYNVNIIDWLKNDQLEMEDVLNLTFSFLKYAHKDNKKEGALEALSKIDGKCVLEWCLKKENTSHHSVRDWLRYEQTNEIIHSLLDEVTTSRSQDGREFAIIKQCLSRIENSEFVISQEATSTILTKLAKTVDDYSLDSDAKINIELISELLIEGFETIMSCNKFNLYLDKAVEIISFCFKVCLNQNCAALEEVWKSMILNLVPYVHSANQTEIIAMIGTKFSDMVAASIASSDCPTGDSIQRMVHQCAKFLHSLEKSEFEGVGDIALLFFDKVQSQTINVWDKPLLNLCFQAEIINGHLDMSTYDEDSSCLNEKSIECCSQSVSKCVMSSLFQVMLFFEMFGVEAKEDRDYSLNGLNANIFSTNMANLVLKSAMFQIFKNNFYKTKDYFKVADFLAGIDTKIKELVQRLDKSGLKEIEKEIIYRGSDSICPGLWAEALYVFHSDILGTEDLNAALHILLEENQLIKSSPLCSKLLPQVFANGIISEEELHCGDLEQELNLLCCHLRNCSSENKSHLIQQHCSAWLDKIVKLGKMNTFETNLSKCKESEVRLAATVADFMSLMVQHCPEQFDRVGWDCPMIATASWILSIHKTVGSEDTFYRSLVQYSSLKRKKQAIAQNLFNWFYLFTDYYLEKQVIEPGLVIILLNELSEIIGKFVEVDLFIDSNGLSAWLDTCCRHMKSHIAHIQITAYNLFLKLVPQIMSRDASYEEGTTNDVSCKRFRDALTYTQSIVDTMLCEFQLGDTCFVEPFTDSYTYTLAYLFLWLSILELCDKADSQLRFMYTGWIKENQFINTLMKTLFCLMPEEAIHTKNQEGNVKFIQDLYAAPPDVSKVMWDSSMVAHLSCFTYHRLLARMPSEVRQWWSQLDHKMAVLVERLTTTFVSPLLTANEMRAIQNDKVNFQNMTVQVRPVAREVAAVYTVEDSRTEIVIQLSVNHPLRPPKVESEKCMVSSAQTRHWVMKLSSFLSHKNGSIWDGLILWKNDLDKKFEGVEECYICFAILCNNQQLPKLVCQTCKKRFHSKCLYKWFTTSNKSSCPICRNDYWAN